MRESPGPVSLLWQELAKATAPQTPAVDARNDIKKESLPTFQIPYDKLVIAVGAYSQTFGIPGVKEHASFLKVHCLPLGLQTLGLY